MARSIAHAARTTALAALAALLLAPKGAAGQEIPLVTDRPDFTESAATVPRGRVQVEAGYTFSRTGEVEGHALGEVLVRVGATGALEGRVGLNSFVIRDAPGDDVDGFEDIAVGFKARVVRPGPLASDAVPQLALLGSLGLPTGGEEIGSEEVQPQAILAAAWSLAPRVGLGANVGVTSVSDGDERFAEWRSSVSGGLSLTERLGAFVEWFALFPEDRATAHFVDSGLTLGLSPDVQVDARLGVGLSDPDPNWFAGVGLAVRR